ncbi:MAG: Nif3-like dinuclear metal center hexameric protein [Erysipelotrichaceae bacterium]|nr:Nif3-like dinuclear metal center hexameric protein [Erysipelotrichaceae bacterium]
MTIQEILDKIHAYHPDLGDARTCDVVVGADPNRECTGILISIAPTVPVIKKAIEVGANFIFVHEPTFWSGYDDECEWLEGNDVYEEKKALLIDNGITVFRDHDHMHAHRPDGIFHYMMKNLGWLEYAVPGKRGFEVVLPPTKLINLIHHIKNVMGLEHIRYIGNPEAIVSKIGFCGHLLPGAHSNWSNNDQVAASWDYDVVIPGETVDWTVPLYFRDAADLGRTKAMIVPGHFVQEEAGMALAEEWLRPVVGDDDLPITFFPAGDMWKYE